MRRPLRASWSWHLDTTDARGLPIHVRCLVPAGDHIGHLAATIKALDDPGTTTAATRRTILLTLADTLIADPSTQHADIWTCYPSSTGLPKLASAIATAGAAFSIFPGQYIPDLFIRHRPAVRASTARRQGSDPGFSNQTNSVHLNPRWINAIYGRHIIVLDDFCTRGHSFECARLLLLTAQARRVDGIAIGRYGTKYAIRTIRPGVAWDPWRPAWLSDDAFIHTIVGSNRSKIWIFTQLTARILKRSIVILARIVMALLQVFHLFVRFVILLFKLLPR